MLFISIFEKDNLKYFYTTIKLLYVFFTSEKSENSDFLNLSAIYQYVNCNLEIIFGRVFICMHWWRGLSLKFMGTVPFNLFAQIQSKEALCTLRKKNYIYYLARLRCIHILQCCFSSYTDVVFYRPYSIGNNNSKIWFDFFVGHFSVKCLIEPKHIDFKNHSNRLKNVVKLVLHYHVEHSQIKLQRLIVQWLWVIRMM